MVSKLGLRSMFVLTLMYAISAILFFALIFFVEPLPYTVAIVTSLVLATIFLLIQFLISPIIMDLVVSWAYGASWMSVEQAFDPDTAAFIRDLEQRYNFSFGKVAVIPDYNPNAFTYGWGKKGARLVISQGILHYLEPEEVRAVVSHEAGHVVHRDFMVMTLASAIPIIFYIIYRTARETLKHVPNETKSSSGKDQSQEILISVAIRIIVLIVAYVFFLISVYAVYLISRYREYYADEFSGVNANPNALSRALAKIAYGIIDAARLAQEQKNPRQRRIVAFRDAVRPLSIFDHRQAQALYMTSAASGHLKSEEENIVKAAIWDLHNPWAFFLELKSTHPLPAKRMRNLKKIAEMRGIPYIYPELGVEKPNESLWDEFLSELFVMLYTNNIVIPAFLFASIFIGIFATFAYYEVDPTLIVLMKSQTIWIPVAAFLLINALIWRWRVALKYPKIDMQKLHVRRIADIVGEEIKASPVRGIPVKIEARVLGRGIPGYFASEDLFVQDDSGVIVVDMDYYLVLNWFFGIFKTKQLLGQNAVIYGWYRRAITPFVVVHKVFFEDGTKRGTWWRGISILFFYLQLSLVLIALLIPFL